MPSSQIERKLAAIMFTDIVGFTKIMRNDETTALSILENQQSLINPIVEEHKGTIIKKMGDGLLIEFPSTVEAVECATEMQDSIKSYNASDDNIEFHIRIGIHLGDIVILGDDILGDGVNIASRIEPLASPDGICITDAVYQSVKSKLKLDCKRINEVDLKHIDDKYTIYKLPKQSDEKVDYKQADEIHFTKIEINSVNNETKIVKSYLKALILMSLSGLIMWLFIMGFILGDEISFHKFQLSDIVGFLILLSIPSFIFSKWKYKVQFKDIRNVSSLLDTLILNYGYEFVNQENNRIEYLHLPRWAFIWNPILKSKYFPNILRNGYVLRIDYDGNTIRIEGMYYHLKSLLWKLKKHYK
jgi:class 3 adenylate cyclase